MRTRQSVRSAPAGNQMVNADPGSDASEYIIDPGWELSLGLNVALTSSRPGHTRVPARSHSGMRSPDDRPGSAPLSSELRHCTACPDPLTRSGSHLGSTLKPGGAVLTRGVFRRSGSVACIRADASPNEVLASPYCTRRVPGSIHRTECRKVNRGPLRADRTLLSPAPDARGDGT